LVPGSVYGGGPRAGATQTFSLHRADVDAEVARRGASLETGLYHVVVCSDEPPEWRALMEAGQAHSTAWLSASSSAKIESEFVGLPRDVKLHPVTREVQSINFLRYDPREGALMHVPLLITDEEKSPGLKRGATMTQTMHSVRCFVRGPKPPNSIVVSLDGIDVGEKATWATHAQLPPTDQCEIELRANKNLLLRDPNLTLIAVRGSRQSRQSETEEAGAEKD